MARGVLSPPSVNTTWSGRRPGRRRSRRPSIPRTRKENPMLRTILAAWRPVALAALLALAVGGGRVYGPQATAAAVITAAVITAGTTPAATAPATSAATRRLWLRPPGLRLRLFRAGLVRLRRLPFRRLRRVAGPLLLPRLHHRRAGLQPVGFPYARRHSAGARGGRGDGGPRFRARPGHRRCGCPGVGPALVQRLRHEADRGRTPIHVPIAHAGPGLHVRRPARWTDSRHVTDETRTITVHAYEVTFVDFTEPAPTASAAK